VLRPRAALLTLFSLATSVAAVTNASAESEILGDARDTYSLQDRHPLNRQLFEQLEEGAESTRMTRGWKHVALMADVSAATQLLLDAPKKTTFHGYAVADTYAAVRPFYGLDANLNLFLATQSASYSYRVSSKQSAGLTLHFYNQDLRWGDDPVRFDLFSVDLGDVTIGQGLLFERSPAEGFHAAVRTRGLELAYLQLGRAFWYDDDLYTQRIGAFDGRIQLALVSWKTDAIPRGQLVQPTEKLEKRFARYATLALDIPVGSAHFAAEYGAKIGDPLRHGLLLRTDVTSRIPGSASVHAGYQFRYYQDGFGPRDNLIPPTTTFNVPAREDMYVTNSFEYLGLSQDYAQWSHTLMLEARVFLQTHLEAFGELELWQRFASAKTDPPRVVYTPDGFRAPGSELRPYYKAGLGFLPWKDKPHRMNAFVTNKQVLSERDVTTPESLRFEKGHYVLLELEAFL
jgi:hypothetical protein